MSRIIHCGCCGVTGHTIRTCQDPSAIEAETNLLAQTNLEAALNMCNSMNPRHIAYILSKNHISSSSGNHQYKLEKLKNMIRNILSPGSLATPPPSPPQTPRFVLMPILTSLNRSIQRTIGLLTRQLIHFESGDGAGAYLKLLPGHPLYSSLQDTISSSYHEFNAITTAYAKIILFGLYKFIGNRSVDQRDFNSKCLTAMSNIDNLKNCVLGHMNTQHLHFCERSILYIISKVRLAHYRLSETNLPRHIDLLQRIYPIVQNSYFESSPYAEQVYQSVVIDINEYLIRNQLYQPPLQSEVTMMKELKIAVKVCDANIPNDAQCSVCWNEELTQDKLIKTGCNHVFCAECITGIAHTRGIKTFIKCPCCRDEISDLSVSNNDQLTLVNNGLAPIAI